MKHCYALSKPSLASAESDDWMSKELYHNPDSGITVTPGSIIDNIIFMFSPLAKWA